MQKTSRSTPLTGELNRAPNADARPLLREMSEEQLKLYRKLACDQVMREGHWREVQLGLVVVAFPLALWLIDRGLGAGFSTWIFVALGILSLAGYWPWRTYRSKALWGAHVAAVDAELARRREAGGTRLQDGPQIGPDDVPDAHT